MINEKYAKSYCPEDISLIENYQDAISDEEKMWEIHHRSECDENGRTLFTKKQLIDIGLYYKCPASESVFVTRSMHNKLHREMRSNGGKIGGKIVGGNEAAKEAERQLGILPSNICNCLKGRRKSAGGFVWRCK